MSTKPITFERAYSGWIFKQEKSETVGEYDSDYYSIEGMTLVTRKRREHLTSDDIKKNKAFMQSLSIGNTNIPDEDSRAFNHRKSLPPPGRPATTWEEYLGAAPGLPPPLGRLQMVKSNSKTFKACVAVSEQFPLSVDVLVDILEVIAPFKHLNKLRRFCEVKLPPGFPVKLVRGTNKIAPFQSNAGWRPVGFTLLFVSETDWSFLASELEMTPFCLVIALLGLSDQRSVKTSTEMKRLCVKSRCCRPSQQR
ncbi:hypothetical protein L596_026315 [Steinernema carpocapsae]|uniref:Ankyrin repeat domain-containing protein n=1 Tax=Steinernema carpocapsae TaxID=34508 RepID=A0A4U5M0Z5_STECR|nr:hypothetical protein L596_026315 [Steinernema carpocapsae]